MSELKFDLSKKETLLMDESVDEALYNHVTVNLFRKILTWGKMLDVSDIAIQEGFPVKIKKNNMVFNITRASVPASAIVRFIGILYQASEGDDSAYQRVMSGDDSNLNYEFKVGKAGVKKVPIRYRVNCLRDGDKGASLVMRYNNENFKKLEEIGLSRDGVIYKNMFPMKGLNLITGAVDSGKTTLLYACLNEYILNDPRHAFINTYENPIEGDLMSVARKNNIQNKAVFQCPVPLGVKTFNAGIEQSLRRNADIILTGEVRTQEEVTALIQGVLKTGKLLLATLHTESIPVTVSRIFNTLQDSNEGKMKTMIYDFIKSMNMIISQTLLPTVDMKRAAVNEVLVFTKEVKNRLYSVPVEELTKEITLIMKESNNTMVDKAKILLSEGVISQETFDIFEDSFSY